MGNTKDHVGAQFMHKYSFDESRVPFESLIFSKVVGENILPGEQKQFYTSCMFRHLSGNRNQHIFKQETAVATTRTHGLLSEMITSQFIISGRQAVD